jgi:hypothetical protein
MIGKSDSDDDGFNGFLSDAAVGMCAGLLVLALVAGVGFYFYNNPLWGSKEGIQIVETSLPSVAKRVSVELGQSLGDAGIVGIEPVYHQSESGRGGLKDYRVLVAGAERVESIWLGVVFCPHDRAAAEYYFGSQLPTAPVDGGCPDTRKRLVRSESHVSMAKVAGAWTVQVVEEVPVYDEPASEVTIADSARLESLDASYQDAKNLIELALIKTAEYKARKADWEEYMDGVENANE